jgi:hypothetical protein
VELYMRTTRRVWRELIVRIGEVKSCTVERKNERFLEFVSFERKRRFFVPSTRVKDLELYPSFTKEDAGNG